jgi:hypothetical protein
MDHRTVTRGSRALVLATGGLLALTVLHDLDHLRQGRDLPLGLQLIGAFGTLGATGLFLWSLWNAKTSARVAVAFGLMTSLGLLVIHVLPRWSRISDPYGEAGVDALSWLSLVAFMISGVVLSVVAYRLVRRPE